MHHAWQPAPQVDGVQAHRLILRVGDEECVAIRQQDRTVCVERARWERDELAMQAWHEKRLPAKADVELADVRASPDLFSRDRARA